MASSDAWVAFLLVAYIHDGLWFLWPVSAFDLHVVGTVGVVAVTILQIRL